MTGGRKPQPCFQPPFSVLSALRQEVRAEESRARPPSLRPPARRRPRHLPPVFFHCRHPRSGSCRLLSILATQPQRPHPPAGGCSALEEQHVTRRRSWKHQLPAVPASPAPGISTEEPQTHPSRAWSSDSGQEAASSVQRHGHLQLQAAMQAVRVWCPDRQPPQSLARQHGARGLQARPSPLPQDTGRPQGPLGNLLSG